MGSVPHKGARFHRYLFSGLIALTLGFRLGAIVLIRPAPVIDEPIHLQAVQQFGPGLPALAQLRDYPSATGPFFYALFGNLGALFGYSLTVFRLGIFALALANLLLFCRILKRLLPTDNPLPAVALLATAPYFPALAGVFMTEHLALFLGLAALLYYLRFRDTGSALDAVLSLLFATLAIYTRSYFIFLPAAFAIADIAARRSSSIVPRSSFFVLRSSLLGAALWLLPILAFLPMALLWRGLAPPSYQHMYHPGFQWQNASSLFIWTGIFFLPWVWRKLRPWHLLALLAIPAVLLAPVPGLGITRSALKLLPHPLAVVVACLFGIIGLLWFIRLASLVARPEMQVAAIGALMLVAGLLVSGPAVYERYLLPGIPLMLICARPGTKPGLALAWAGLFQLPVALVHILHLAG
ncbi:MAG: glycosyltransferase family 39 protein [candidate division WOR-3 bacterium]|nr:glycosyltransferase family 39 protein [candidate division WOR-3 bacterium]